MYHRTFRRAAGGTLLCALAALSACADQPAELVAPPIAAAEQDMVERIVAMGFQREMIVDAGDHFVVEGDIAILKADLRGPVLNQSVAPGGDPRFHWRTTYIVSQSKMAQGIKVDLTGISSSSIWMNAARAAITYWNATQGTKIYLYEASPGDISFSFGTLTPAGTAGRATWPRSNGNPGPSIIISHDVPMDQNQKRWTVVHELGHTLGYRHTDYVARNEPADTMGAVHIPGTPTGSDNASVFRGTVSSIPSWNGFSSYDQIANRTLYPGPAPTLTFQGFDGSSHPRLTWSAVSEVSHYVVSEWVYRYEFILYDPQVSSTNGYWGYQSYFNGDTSVYGTSYTDTNAVADNSGNCYTEYYITPVYPSSKRGSSQYATFDAC